MDNAPSTLIPPFGRHALPPEREAWRLKAASYPDTRMGRMLRSRARKKALAGETGPFDVDVADGVRARLYPAENRCEKYAFAGITHWDAQERAALKSAIEGHGQETFTFFDVGANIGLYSLFAQAYARAANIPLRIIAIEPGLETCARLEDNLKASGLSAQIIRAAVSDMPGTGYLSKNNDNRGEAKLEARSGSAPQEEVIIDTLARICRINGVARIDAMKVDIEGHDFKALTAFFEDGTPALHPSLLIVETGSDMAAALIELCRANDYVVSKTAGLNTIFIKRQANV